MSKLNLVLTMPAVHHFRNEDDGPVRPEQERWWTRWGWCQGSNFLEHIYYRFNHVPIRWSAVEFFERFPVTPKRIGSLKGTPDKELLIITVIPGGEYLILNLKEFKREPRNQPFYVPAGWAKEVLAALEAGGRRLQRFDETELFIVYDEVGNPVKEF